MSSYYVNRTAQPNGDHEVHDSVCRYLPSSENRIYLGELTSCTGAVNKAREHFLQVNGCFYCSNPCHTQ